LRGFLAVAVAVPPAPNPNDPEGRFPLGGFFGGGGFGGGSSVGRALVSYPVSRAPGTIVISTRERQLQAISTACPA
jgi:hypothetical protein